MGYSLNYASEELKNDKDIVLLAVNNYGPSLEFASDRLKNDKDVVNAATKNDRKAIRYASEDLKNDEEIERNEDGEYIGDGVLIIDHEEIHKILKPKAAGKLVTENLTMDLYSEEWNQESLNSNFNGGGFYLAGGEVIYKGKKFIDFEETGGNERTMNASCEIVDKELFLEFILDFIRDENDGKLPAGYEGAGLYSREWEDTVEYCIKVDGGEFKVITKENEILEANCDIDDPQEPGVTWFLMNLFGGYYQSGEPQEDIEVDMDDAEEQEIILGNGFAYGD